MDVEQINAMASIVDQSIQEKNLLLLTCYKQCDLLPIRHCLQPPTLVACRHKLQTITSCQTVKLSTLFSMQSTVYKPLGIVGTQHLFG